MEYSRLALELRGLPDGDGRPARCLDVTGTSLYSCEVTYPGIPGLDWTLGDDISLVMCLLIRLIHLFETQQVRPRRRLHLVLRVPSDARSESSSKLNSFDISMYK